MTDQEYDTLVAMLGKLQRNETQMTEQQKTQYAVQLADLRRKITKSAGTLAKAFITGGYPIKPGEPEADECCKRINEITKADQARAEYDVALGVLFRTYDPLTFTQALMPLHNRVRYEGYAPYWCQHCTPYTGRSYRGKPLTFWNDLIEMGWNEAADLWCSQTEDKASLSLPPTMEQVKEMYEYETKRWLKRAASLEITE